MNKGFEKFPQVSDKVLAHVANRCMMRKVDSRKKWERIVDEGQAILFLFIYVLRLRECVYIYIYIYKCIHQYVKSLCADTCLLARSLCRFQDVGGSDRRSVSVATAHNR